MIYTHDTMTMEYP